MNVTELLCKLKLVLAKYIIEINLFCSRVAIKCARSADEFGKKRNGQLKLENIQIEVDHFAFGAV